MLDHPKGWSLLHLAAALGHAPCVKYLLGCNVPVNGAKVAHETTLRAAHPHTVCPAGRKHAICVGPNTCQMLRIDHSLFCLHGPVQMQTHVVESCCCCHPACTSSHREHSNLCTLLQRSVDPSGSAAADKLRCPRPDVENPEGLSPLHCAALADSMSCAKLLLGAKADPALASSDGRSVVGSLTWAQEGMPVTCLCKMTRKHSSSPVLHVALPPGMLSWPHVHLWPMNCPVFGAHTVVSWYCVLYACQHKFSMVLMCVAGCR